MNHSSRIIITRTLGLGLIAGLSLIQAAQAAPETYGPRGTVRFEPLPAAQQPCRTVVRNVWDGSTKGRKEVTVQECNRAQARKVKSWAGPRNTIPGYQ
ncbi:MAG TPA: hypothetical protein QF361_01865 [Gammaproteobacteria bacterium]|nr:hypothetical protein [Gammaproteobacteria bacterium]